MALGCIGEYIAEFTNWLSAGVKERKERLSKISTLILIGALAAELICLVRTNQKSGELVGSLGQVASEADKAARNAVNKSDHADVKASEAETASGKAISDSGRAASESSSALSQAPTLVPKPNHSKTILSPQRLKRRLPNPISQMRSGVSRTRGLN